MSLARKPLHVKRKSLQLTLRKSPTGSAYANVKRKDRMSKGGCSQHQKSKSDSQGRSTETYSGPNRRLYNSGQLRFRHGHNVQKA